MKPTSFKSMSFRRKLRYIFCDHCWDLFLGSILLLLIGTLVWQEWFAAPSKLCLEMINGQDPASRTAVMPMRRSMDGPVTRCAEPPRRDLEVSMVFQTDDAPNAIPCDPEKLMMCAFLAQRSDVYFWKDSCLEDILTDNILMDLRRVLPAALLEQYRDQLVLSAPLLEGGYPCAIRLEHNAWLEANPYYEGSCLVGLPWASRNADEAVDFLISILK